MQEYTVSKNNNKNTKKVLLLEICEGEESFPIFLNN